MLKCDICGAETPVQILMNAEIRTETKDGPDFWFLSATGDYRVCSRRCFDQLVWSNYTEADTHVDMRDKHES